LLSLTTIGKEPVELFSENDGEKIQFSSADRKRVGNFTDDGLFETSMDAIAVSRQGEAFTRAPPVVTTQTTSVATVNSLPLATSGTLRWQTRGGRWLFLCRTVIRLIGLFVHLLPGFGWAA
jgi:hypothetical protein